MPLLSARVDSDGRFVFTAAAIRLSEVFEFAALSAAWQSSAAIARVMYPYKLFYANLLIDLGLTYKASAYVEVIRAGKKQFVFSAALSDWLLETESRLNPIPAVAPVAQV